MVISLLMSTLVQWFLFLLLPMACYAIFMRKHYKLGEMFGLQKASSLPQREMWLLVGLNIFFLVYNEWRLTHYGLYLEDIRYQAYQNFGWSGRTILIILVYSLIKTSFLEELVFRGFMINALRLFFFFACCPSLASFSLHVGPYDRFSDVANSGGRCIGEFSHRVPTRLLFRTPLHQKRLFNSLYEHLAWWAELASGFH